MSPTPCAGKAGSLARAAVLWTAAAAFSSSRESATGGRVHRRDVPDIFRNASKRALTSGYLVEFEGEFHTGLRKNVDALTSFKSERCQTFYGVRPEKSGGPTVFDEHTELFRPKNEAPNAKGAEMQERPFKRMLTYEDVTVPTSFSSDFFRAHTPNIRLQSGWCEPFAVHSSQRPVKVISAKAPGDKRLMVPAIWKCASTTLDKMLGDNAHETNESFCDAKNNLQYCHKQTTFVPHCLAPDFTFAAVRSPLDRFLATVYEHGQWSLCDDGVCQESVQDARDLAGLLLGGFPHDFRSCPQPTQSYFLSATNADGEVYNWDQIGRIEDLPAELAKLNHRTGMQLGLPTQLNPSGNKEINKMYFDAVFADNRITCTVCKIYAQDFECLGYQMPDTCTHETCGELGIDLPPVG